jgi:regulator of nucleoside diphosphate kinase
MEYMSLPSVSIPESDRSRLDRVVRQAAADHHPVAAFLACELLRANALPAHEFPVDTVTLDRWATFRPDRGWQAERRQLVCPQDYQLAELHLSVLSPLGAALIGLHVGSQIPYRSIEGVMHVACVESLGASSLGAKSLETKSPGASAIHQPNRKKGGEP